ncbi:hypothetical protein SAMN05216175_103346 [Neptunomonas qingdaonensis]|uniref:Uncharacterized protein n=1 Tax=Neptunomonas qingdaonensis TaxID=1045558 RepID=A0A1I2P9K2_9GAMM|nr:hypothetical protein SAMN05216175_103346 [Neptunomonas qingdaonensis]
MWEAANSDGIRQENLRNILVGIKKPLKSAALLS